MMHDVTFSLFILLVYSSRPESKLLKVVCWLHEKYLSSHNNPSFLVHNSAFGNSRSPILRKTHSNNGSLTASKICKGLPIDLTERKTKLQKRSCSKLRQVKSPFVMKTVTAPVRPIRRRALMRCHFSAPFKPAPIC